MTSQAKFLRSEGCAQLVAQSCNGDVAAVEVPMKVFYAMKEFTEGRKTGSITLQFKDGSVAGVVGSYSFR